MLVRSLQRPTNRHWKALRHVARYLKATRTHGLLYTRGPRILSSESDANFAGCQDSRSSTYGNFIHYGHNIISWCSRRIKTVVLSTCEAEYIALSNTSRHLLWIRELAQELSGLPLPPPNMFADNTSAVAVAKASGNTRNGKYIEVRYHFIRQQVERGLVVIQHRASEDLAADILTKALAAPKYQRHILDTHILPPTEHLRRL